MVWLSTGALFSALPEKSPESSKQTSEIFNDMIVRLATDPQFRRSDRLGSSPGTCGGNNSVPIPGDIGIPVISLHTIGELFVSLSVEQIYVRPVAAHGKSDLLVSRAIRDVFHCGFMLCWLNLTRTFSGACVVAIQLVLPRVK